MAITTTAALILGGSALLGSGISGWANWYGMNKQEKANEKAYEKNLAVAQQQQAIEKKELAKQWAWKEEDRDYQRRMSAITQAFQAVSSNPGMQNQMINIWRS